MILCSPIEIRAFGDRFRIPISRVPVTLKEILMSLSRIVTLKYHTQKLIIIIQGVYHKTHLSITCIVDSLYRTEFDRRPNHRNDEI
jgi:hypothetical protein